MRGACWVLSVMVAAAQGCGGGGGTDAGVVDARGVPRDDGYPSVCGASMGACNWVTNQGCSEGNGCYRALVDGGVRQLCAPVGAGAWGAACTRANECQPGLACLGEPGRCTPLCCGSDHPRCQDAARGGRPAALCVGAVVGTDTRFCLEAVRCDPLRTSDNGCASDRPRCDLIAADGTTACGALRGPPGADGAGCCRSESCAPGYACIRDPAVACSDASPIGVCRRFCATAEDAGVTCPAGQRCTLRFEGLPATLGACAPPR